VSIADILAKARQLELDRDGVSSRASVDIDNVECTRETEKALLCTLFGLGEEYWIPKSQIRRGSHVRAEGDSGTLCITAWFAAQCGIHPK
jgi:hypothetical protein